MTYPYAPGLHILATFAAPPAALTDAAACEAFFTQLIQDLQLTAVGAAYHAFPEGGFTAVVALTESHLSIHTWPEHGLATFDVFLSNFRRDNADRARQLYQATLAFFGGQEQSRTEVRR
ncbi:S-adenosylmethionine decarboxylase family protein [Hymenobacter weizhouensis]|uniref:S-adenosylmethionine decarboxylase family protein n=1 Tax=Hymenobacter sp. YIM 151500-1 TaxID=2987689 RepID=UPI0022270EDC|nr:S-adenosylmethionine decarboxylase [Hymenobacter sp. YIM 151500-1]UYZ64960.1 S-adenosylmethionine decarboxylase [Hymenobacter sp. YIM 151500-1]